MENSLNLSTSMENYLETILWISEKEGSAHITEIAERLEIAASSVHETIRKLSNLSLVKQEKYGPVILTEKGEKYAKSIACKHQIIKQFLVEILEVNEKTADQDACMIEHEISNQTMTALLKYLRQNSEVDEEKICIKKYLLKEGNEKDMEVKNIESLDNLKVGDSGVIKRIKAKGKLKKKLLEMGITKGSKVKIVGKAPLGDPLEINIRGYNLSLRKKEAENIYLEEQE